MVSISSEHVEQFRRDGYLVVEDFLTPSECDKLRERAFQIIREADISQHPSVSFSTHGENQQARNTDHFLTSGDKIRIFYEDSAIGENGKPNVPLEQAVFMLAHGLHIRDEEFKKVTFSDKMKGIMKSLDLKKPSVFQSMVIFKQPNFGAAVNPHQDSTYHHTVPMSVIGFWIALEDADVDNGCLWFVPGSHKYGVPQRLLKTVAEDGTIGTRFEGDLSTYPGPEEYVATPVKKGTLVIIHGEVVHMSGENKSSRSRNIYGFHVYDAGMSEWSQENWLQPPTDQAFPCVYD